MMYANLIDMGGGLGVKYLSYLVGLGYVAFAYRHLRLTRTEVTAAFALFILVPAWSLLNGMLSGGSPLAAQTQITPFIPGLLYFVLLAGGGAHHALRAFWRGLLGLALFSSTLTLAVLLVGREAGELMLNLFARDDEAFGKFGYRLIGTTGLPSVYLRPTLFYVAGFVYGLFTRRRAAALLFLAALVMAVSKAGIVLCLAFAGAYLFVGAQGRDRLALGSLFALAFFGVSRVVDPVLLFDYLDYIQRTLSGEAGTTQVRLGHIRSTLALLREHPTYLLWGHGTGVPFYTAGRGEYHVLTEMHHLDAIRWFGLVWLLAFSTIVAGVGLRLLRRGTPAARAWGLALGALFVAAGTNPVLITPPFLMLLAALYHAAKRPGALARVHGPR
jgi:hypothetical protein